MMNCQQTLLEANSSQTTAGRPVPGLPAAESPLKAGACLKEEIVDIYGQSQKLFRVCVSDPCGPGRRSFCNRSSGQSQKLYRVSVPDPRGLGNSGKNCFFHMIASEKSSFYDRTFRI
jgi:hypothetical protein